MSMSRPKSVGNTRRLLVSDQAGKSNILAELERHRRQRSPRTIRA